MNRNIPSSIYISLYLAAILTGIHFLIRIYQSGGLEPIQEFLIFFISCFSLLVGVLEWFVLRKIKNLQFMRDQEITKLKSMEAYRREFLGEVSHELKTPIFAVQGFIHTLIEGAMDDDKVKIKFLKKAMKNADRLSDLVQDLLIITQAESGEMEMKVRKFYLHDVIGDVVDTLEYKFTKKNRHIRCRVVSNGLDETLVLADQERIQQVLTNLVDNAIKYGDQDGEIIIETTPENEKVFVHVHNEGPGIEPVHMDKIFRRFYRVDKSRSREKGGTGLGLAICKHLIEAHGEKIWVESEEEKGATFSFSLNKSL